MLMPSISKDNLLGDFFDLPFDRYGTGNPIDTNIKDADNGYRVTINMPGVEKEDVKAELRDGYLTIQTSTDSNKEEKDSNGRYIRRERYNGPCSRSFYIGDAVTQEDIETKFEDGALRLLVPKKGAVPEMEERKYIAIEG